MKYILGLIAVFLTTSLFALEKGYFFYDANDIANIKLTAQSERGKKIVDALKSKVEERRTHPMALPTEKSGRMNWYVCDVHNTTLVFDWDKPHEHFCPVCKKYLKSPRYDAVWTKYVHARNASYMEDCMWIYYATGEKKYAEYIREMLLDYSKLYPTFAEPDAEALIKDYHLSRMYDQWLDDCVWVAQLAPAYMAIEEILTDAQRHQIKEKLFHELAEQQMNRTGNNNWQVWNNCARIMLGVVLRDDEMIDIALNGKKGLSAAFKTEVNPDGWYDEASVNYHFFPLRGFLNASNALRCRGIDLFGENDKLHAMFTAVIGAIYPDWTVVAHNDGNYAQSPLAYVGMYEFDYSRTKTKFMEEILSQFYARAERKSPYSLLNPKEIAPASAPLKLASKLFPDTGFAVLRSGKNTATLTWGESNGGHAHPHRLAIAIHNGQKEILPDFGTPGYGSVNYRTWYQKTLAHNTLVVDGKDQGLVRTKGSLLRFDEKANLVSASADKAYKDVKMQRTVELNTDLLTDNFEASAATEHVYDYVLHLRDKPSFENELQDAKLENAPYSLIRKLQTFTAKSPVKIKTESADLEISNLLNGDMEIFAGIADGPITAAAKDESDCIVYTVIVRTKAKGMNMRTLWKIK